MFNCTCRSAQCVNVMVLLSVVLQEDVKIFITSPVPWRKVHNIFNVPTVLYIFCYNTSHREYMTVHSASGITCGSVYARQNNNLYMYIQEC